MPRQPRDRNPTPRHTLAVRPDGTASVLSADEVRTNDQALDALVGFLGGRAVIRDTLAVAYDQPEVGQIASFLLDPRYDGYSLQKLCKLASLTVVDLFAAYKKALVVQAQLRATKVITEKLEAVVEDVMRRAAPYEIPCYECGGSGQVADPDTPARPPVTCRQCAGQGKVLQLPDLDRQKVALELGQLVQKAGGINIQQNTLVAGEGSRGPGGSLVDLQQAVRELLSGPREPLPADDPSAGEIGDPDPPPVAAPTP